MRWIALFTIMIAAMPAIAVDGFHGNEHDDTPQTRLMRIGPDPLQLQQHDRGYFVTPASARQRVAFRRQAITPIDRQSICKIKAMTPGGYGQGTGSVIYSDSEHCLVLTNSHVIDDGQTIIVETTHGAAQAAVVAYNAAYMHDGIDIALLLIRSPAELPAIPVRPTIVSDGEPVYSAGFPLDASRLQPRSGNASAERLSMGIASFESIKTTAVVQHGESGSPLVSRDGHLVAVIESKSESGSYAVPSTAVIDQVQKTCFGRGQILHRIGTRILQRAGMRSQIGCNSGQCGPSQCPPIQQAAPMGPIAIVPRPMPSMPSRPGTPHTGLAEPVYQSAAPSMGQPMEPISPGATQQIAMVDLSVLADVLAADDRFRGRDGEPGAPGPPGRDGIDGIGRGPTPQQLEQIIAELRESLRGDPSLRGADGAPGPPGRDGIDGIGRGPTPQQLEQIIAELRESLRGDPALRGADGRDGAPAEPVDTNAIAAAVIEQLRGDPELMPAIDIDDLTRKVAKKIGGNLVVKLQPAGGE